MKRCFGLAAFSLVVLLAGVPAPAEAAPEGQLTLGLHFSLAPVWFDPADVSGIITPYWILYGLHDALVKPMPGKAMAPSLAESWTVSADGLTYEFVLRKGVRFHNGDLLTADDVKFSFDRYRGASTKMLKDKVRQGHVLHPHRVRFPLKEPRPGLLGFFDNPPPPP